MTKSIRHDAPTCQADSIAHCDATRAKDVALAIVLARLRACISDRGYSLEALAVAMGKGESYAAYISKVLTAEKPLSYEFIIALPDDVEAEFHSRSAKDFGRMVVTPATGEDAVRQFVAGLFGLLQPQFPEKASAPLKAALPTADQARRRA